MNWYILDQPQFSNVLQRQSLVDHIVVTQGGGVISAHISVALVSVDSLFSYWPRADFSKVITIVRQGLMGLSKGLMLLLLFIVLLVSIYSVQW